MTKSTSALSFRRYRKKTSAASSPRPVRISMSNHASCFERFLRCFPRKCDYFIGLSMDPFADSTRYCVMSDCHRNDWLVGINVSHSSVKVTSPRTGPYRSEIVTVTLISSGPKACQRDKMLAIERSKSMLYLTWHRQETVFELFRYLSCSKQTSFKTDYKLNSGLTVMLTEVCVCVCVAPGSLMRLRFPGRGRGCPWPYLCMHLHAARSDQRVAAVRGRLRIQGVGRRWFAVGRRYHVMWCMTCSCDWFDWWRCVCASRALIG